MVKKQLKVIKFLQGCNI